MKNLKNHFYEHFPLYAILGTLIGLFVLGFMMVKYNRAQHGKIEVIGGCEYVKLYVAGREGFQYIHKPNCANCAFLSTNQYKINP